MRVLRSLPPTGRQNSNIFYLIDMEAGIALHGSEIKSIRAGQVSLAEAYVQINESEAWLMDAHIAPYEQSGKFFNHEPRRPRKLLLHSDEIRKLMGGGAPKRGDGSTDPGLP